MTRDKIEKEIKQCSRCNRKLEAYNFKLYYYQPTKNGKASGEKKRGRVSNCNDCVRYKKRSNSIENLVL